MPITVYDANDQPSTVDESIATQQLLDGTAGVDSAAQFKMLDSDGKTWTVPGSGVQKALQNGWSLGTNFGADTQRKLQTQAENMGPLETFALTGARKGEDVLLSPEGRQLLNTSLHGEEATAEHNAVVEQAQKLHPTATSVGNLYGNVSGAATQIGLAEGGGFLGGLAEKGILGTGAEQAIKSMTEEAIEQQARTSLTRTLAAKVANQSIQGAALSSLQVATQLALGDPKGAAESFLMATGISSVLDMAGAGASKASGLVKGLLEGGEGEGTSLASKAALKGSGIQLPEQLENVKPGMADFLNQEVLDKPLMSGEERISKLKNLEESSAVSIKDMNQKLDSLLDKHEELQQYSFQPAEVAMKVESQLSPGLETPIAAGARAELNKIVSEIGETGAASPISMTEAYQLKNKFQPTPLSPDASLSEIVRQQAAQIVSTEYQNSARQIVAQATAKGLVQPDAFADYLKQAATNQQAANVLAYGSDVSGNLGGGLPLLGAVAGGLHGGAIGYAAKLLLKNLDRDQALNTGAYYLNKVLKNPENVPYVGALIAHNSVKAVNAHLDDLQSTLGAAIKSIAQLSATHNIKQQTPNGGSGLSKHQQFQTVATQIQTLANNPDRLATQIAPIVATLQTHAPDVASEYVKGVQNAITYLNTSLPKNPQPLNQPFQLANAWEPTSQQIMEWDQRLGTIMNPGGAIKSVIKGNATKAQIDTLRAVFPLYTEQAKNRLLLAGMNKSNKISKAGKVKISFLIGAPIGGSMSNLPSYQATYTPAGQQPKPNAAAPLRGASHIKDMPSWNPNPSHKDRQ